MGDWTGQAMEGFAFAERQVAALLRLMGQDNEGVTLGATVLVALLLITLSWAFLLSLLRSFTRSLGGGRGSEPRDLRRDGFGFSGPVASGPGRLDVVPSAAARPSMRPLEPASPEAKAPEAKAPEAKAREPKVSIPKPRQRPAARLSEAAGALPISPAEDMRQVQLRQLPRLTDRGMVVSARPEWTGKVVPGSLQDAGAVEICRVLSRRAPARAGSETVRAVDYRVCGLPRVDGEGRRQPDILVYTVADRGFLPKSAPAKPGRR